MIMMIPVPKSARPLPNVFLPTLFLLLAWPLARCTAFEEIHEEHPGSKLLQDLGFSILFTPPKSKDESPDQTVYGVYIFFDADHASKRFELDRKVSVQLVEAHQAVVFEPEATLGMINDFPTYAQHPDQPLKQRFGLTFTAAGKFLKTARLRLGISEPHAPVETNLSGGHFLSLREFMPDSGQNHR